MSQSDVRFYARHIRAADLCMSGGRLYFKDKGWDWDHFLDHGKLVSDIEAEGDPHALKVAAKAREEAESNGIRR